jgi:pimeloyl-ACP methyl ester carboxylesterase
MKKRIIQILLFLLLAVGPISCNSETIPELTAAYETGTVTRIEDTYGTFFVYVPESGPSKPDILVLVHGTPAQSETPEETASYYVTNWLDFAEEQGIVLIAPAFSHEDFSSRKGEIEDMMTGYRGLFGREIGADEWVLRIVNAYRQALGSTEGKFSLYGHSAGGQFVGRFLVTHPEMVEKAVITAAVTYPQPNPDVAWPYGMGELHTQIEWDENTIRTEDVIPDEQKWLEATQIPLTVLVGLGDMSEQLERPGQKGPNRVMIGKNWVQDMILFAEENGLECHWKFEVVPGKGHSMFGLAPFSQEALVSMLRQTHLDGFAAAMAWLRHIS